METIKTRAGCEVKVWPAGGRAPMIARERRRSARSSSDRWGRCGPPSSSSPSGCGPGARRATWPTSELAGAASPGARISREEMVTHRSAEAGIFRMAETVRELLRELVKRLPQRMPDLDRVLR